MTNNSTTARTYYKPATEYVRTMYSHGVTESNPNVARDEAVDEFDRFIARVKAEAWDEGWGHAAKAYRASGTGPRTRNPYKL